LTEAGTAVGQLFFISSEYLVTVVQAWYAQELSFYSTGCLDWKGFWPTISLILDHLNFSAGLMSGSSFQPTVGHSLVTAKNVELPSELDITGVVAVSVHLIWMSHGEHCLALLALHM
jgi:hypothetical protein